MMHQKIPDSPTPARLVGRPFRRGEGVSVGLALIGTILLHVGIFFLAPDELTRTLASAERRQDPQLQIVLPDLEEPEPPPDQFILTNPEAFSNPPDETRFFSDREQQAAQEEETDSGDPSLPTVEGEEPEETQNIISDETVFPPLEEEVLPSMPGEDGGETTFEPLPERPISGFDPADEPDGLEVPVTPDVEQDLEEDPVFGVDLGKREAPKELAEAGETAGAAGETRVMPRPRPTLPQISPGPTGTRHGAAPRVGRIAVDANFSEYGDYLARMLEVIVRQWHVLAWDSLQSSEVGTVVSVSFRVDAAGEIHGLEVLHSTASLIATLICQDAIAARQPYGVWTSDMQQVLGEEQTIRIRFHYR